MKMQKSCQTSSSVSPLMRRLHNDYQNGLPSSELMMPSRVFPLIEAYLRAYATQLSFVEAITTDRQDDSILIKFVFQSDKSDTKD